MSDDATLKGLEKRIVRLEVARGVVIGVALVLAAFVTAFFTRLLGAQSQIDELTAQTKFLKREVEESLARLQEAADSQVGRIAAAAGAYGVPRPVGTHGDEHGGSGYSILDTSGVSGSAPMAAASLVDVEAAENYAKEMLKAATKNRCSETRPEDWHRAQTVLDRANRSKSEGQYDRALGEFAQVRESAERCINGRV